MTTSQRREFAGGVLSRAATASATEQLPSDGFSTSLVEAGNEIRKKRNN
jgi:hypothetical protein